MIKPRSQTHLCAFERELFDPMGIRGKDILVNVEKVPPMEEQQVTVGKRVLNAGFLFKTPPLQKQGTFRGIGWKKR